MKKSRGMAAPRFAADAALVNGSDVVPDDLAANHHRVGGRAANPTRLYDRGVEGYAFHPTSSWVA